MPVHDKPSRHRGGVTRAQGGTSCLGCWPSLEALDSPTGSGKRYVATEPHAAAPVEARWRDFGAFGGSVPYSGRAALRATVGKSYCGVHYDAPSTGAASASGPTWVRGPPTSQLGQAALRATLRRKSSRASAVISPMDFLKNISPNLHATGPATVLIAARLSTITSSASSIAASISAWPSEVPRSGKPPSVTSALSKRKKRLLRWLHPETAYDHSNPALHRIRGHLAVEIEHPPRLRRLECEERSAPPPDRHDRSPARIALAAAEARFHIQHPVRRLKPQPLQQGAARRYQRIMSARGALDLDEIARPEILDASGGVESGTYPPPPSSSIPAAAAIPPSTKT
jgi:hypothetical protein